MSDETQRSYNLTYTRWDNGTRVACVLVPIVIAFAFERQLAAAFSREGAFAIMIGAQMASVIVLPDMIATFVADRLHPGGRK